MPRPCEARARPDIELVPPRHPGAPDAPAADQVKGGAGGAGTPTTPVAPTLKPISTPKYIVPCI